MPGAARELGNLLTMYEDFKPGDYIITSEGVRGYIIDKADGCEDMYDIRLTSGYTVCSGDDIELDVGMLQEKI